jgi:hypothetical protein
MDTATENTTQQPPLVPPAPPEAEVVAAEHSEAEDRTPEKLFRFSRWLHIGVGAEECEHKEDGTCEDPQHFHAWCRLPNQFQHESIREKALAAKARRIRTLKDPESDGHTIVEFALDELRATGDTEAIVAEILQKDRMKRHIAVVEELKATEEFEHIDEDRERLRALEGEPEETRPADEFATLQRHVGEFEETVVQKKDEAEEPEKQALMQRSLDDLIDMVRQDRIERDGARQFMDTFGRWEWFIGTMKTPTPAKAMDYENQRYFASIKHLEATADEVLNALDITFAGLEAELAAVGKGS